MNSPPPPLFTRRQFLLALLILLTTAFLEHAMGRLLISQSGHILLWVSSPHSPENSQQLLDWYSLSHLIHGFLFYFFTRLLSRRHHWSLGQCLLLTLCLESSWELLENSPLIINRYRQSALAAGYNGDSILNSLSDILCCTAGFLTARLLPPRLTITLAITMELLAAYTIHDNLTLNILMLLHPFQSIQHWQMAIQ